MEVVDASLERLSDNDNKGFKPVCGKVASMKVHLKKCQLVAPEIRKLAADSDKTPKLVVPTGTSDYTVPGASSSSLLGLPNPSPLLIGSCQLSSLSPLPGFSSTSSTVPLPPVSDTAGIVTPYWPPATKRQKLNSGISWTKEIRDEFQHDHCLTFVSSGLAWNAISDVQMCHFLAKWIPGAEIPDCHKLSGPILNEEAKRVTSKIRLRTQGCFATGQSDGWKNVAKASVITSMITVDFEVKWHTVRANLMSYMIVGCPFADTQRLC